MARRTEAMVLAGSALALTGVLVLTSMSTLWMSLLR
jgi:hypothetical protein